MKLKKILSGFLAAAMAVTTMVTATFNAGAELGEGEIMLIDLGSAHGDAKSIVVTYDLKCNSEHDYEYKYTSWDFSMHTWSNASSAGENVKIGLGGEDQKQWYSADYRDLFVAYNGTAIMGGKITYTFKYAPDNVFEVAYKPDADGMYDITFSTVELFSGEDGTGTSLYTWTNPDSDPTQYAAQPIDTSGFKNNSLSFPGTFNKANISGANARIEVTWSVSNLEYTYDAGLRLAKAGSWKEEEKVATMSAKTTSGSQTSVIYLKDIADTMYENMWICGYANGEGSLTIDSVVIYNGEDKGDIYTLPSSAIGADNFTFSTYKNISMEIGDTFTVTFNSVVGGVGVPEDKAFNIKLKVPNKENPVSDTTDYDYYEPVSNSEVVGDGTAGQAVTGLKVTSEKTSETQTVFTFTAVSASTCEYGPFMVTIEITKDGTAVDWLGFTDDMGYFVPAAAHTITITTPTNGTITTDKEDNKAAKDEVVTLTVTPAKGYELETLTVTPEVTITDNTADETKKTFTMPDADVTVSATFKIKEVPLTGITLNKTTETVLVNGTKTLTATKAPEDTTDTSEIVWSSSNTDVATVAGDGATCVVTGVAAGTAKITAACGTFIAECAVEVTADAIECTAISLDKATAEVATGKTVKLTATPTPSNTTDEMTWTTSNSTIATVAADGTVTGVAAGTATITVKCGATATATCTVTVTSNACTSITLDKTTAEVKKGATVTLTATALPEGTPDEITWESGAPAVATVDQTGKVTGVARGKATITVKCGEQSATCEVAVTEDKAVAAPVAAGGQKSYDVVAEDGTKTVDTVYAITEADLACKGYKVTIKNETNGKTITREITNAYKSVSVKSAEDLGNDTFTGYFLIVRVKNVPENVTLTYSFEKIS